MADRTARSFAASEAAFLKARQVMPGGVSSPVRAYKAVGGNPVFIKEGDGCTLTDLDGNKYIDYVAAYGPQIAGHANEQVEAALAKAIGRGTSFGAPTEVETALASLIISAMPALEMVRFVNSGTEAVMSAIRLARAATQRDKIIKCVGCYHGHADTLLVQVGSGALTMSHGEAPQIAPSSPGVPQTTTANTLLVPYNDLSAAGEMFHQLGGQIAAFIVEPVAGNMGVVPPDEGYLQGLRDLCDQHGALLIFDEVMTGFRVAWGGAQQRYGVTPDLTCLGKIIGGGLPVGAYAGAKKLMELISPVGNVYQAGTLSGNPLTMVAGAATIETLKEPGAYESLDNYSQLLCDGLQRLAGASGVPLVINRVGSMFTPFFVKEGVQRVQNFADASACDTGAYATFFRAMLENGVFLPPSQFEAWFVSLSHDESAIIATLKAAERGLAAVTGK